MSPAQKIRKGLMGLAALGALALGGSAIAGAAGTTTSTTSTTAASSSSAANQGPRPDPTKPGGHVGDNGKTEKALSSDVAAKVKAAAQAKVAGGTVLRVETDVDHGSPYEAHVQKSDGSEVEVLVNSNFQVTAVNAMMMGHP